MPTDKCPNCGANVSPESAICVYCGTAITRSGYHWIAVKDMLPNASATDPTRSHYVLTAWAGSSYDDSILSAYYDHSSGTWLNERYAGLVDNEPVVTHWMPLPSADSPDWISIYTSKPTEPVDDPADDFVYSKHVLGCDKKGSALDYQRSMKVAQYLLDPDDLDYWFSYFPEQPTDDPNYGAIAVTHWMPLPAGPK